MIISVTANAYTLEESIRNSTYNLSLFCERMEIGESIQVSLTEMTVKEFFGKVKEILKKIWESLKKAIKDLYTNTVMISYTDYVQSNSQGIKNAIANIKSGKIGPEKLNYKFYLYDNFTADIPAMAFDIRKQAMQPFIPSKDILQAIARKDYNTLDTALKESKEESIYKMSSILMGSSIGSNKNFKFSGSFADNLEEIEKEIMGDPTLINTSNADVVYRGIVDVAGLSASKFRSAQKSFTDILDKDYNEAIKTIADVEDAVLSKGYPEDLVNKACNGLRDIASFRMNMVSSISTFAMKMTLRKVKEYRKIVSYLLKIDGIVANIKDKVEDSKAQKERRAQTESFYLSMIEM